MSTLADKTRTNKVHAVLAEDVNRLIASSLRPEYKNVQTLTGDIDLTDGDMPLQIYDCDGADRISKLPPADAENNHLFLFMNESSGSELLSILSNDETVTHAVLRSGEYLLVLPDGTGTYVTIGKPFGKVLTPSQVTANQNDWFPTGAGSVDVLRISTDASRDFTGFGFPAAYKLILVVNSGSNPAVFKNESASSLAANRFSFGADLTLATLQAVLMWYDPTSARWRMVGGGGSGGGGGLTVVVASVTGSNVTVAEDTHYILNLSGLTGDRDFPLPTPSAAGKKVKMTVSVGDDAFALILKVNGTEVTRSFITNETFEFTSYGTGAGDWAMSQNGKIMCHAILERQTAQSINNATATKVQLATAVANVGSIGDTTNYKVVSRRLANYEISLFGSLGSVFEDQEFLEVEAYVNGALKKFYASHTSSGATNRYQSPSLIFKMPLAVGDYVEFYLFHNEGAAQNTDTTYYPQLAVLET